MGVFTYVTLNVVGEESVEAEDGTAEEQRRRGGRVGRVLEK